MIEVNNELIVLDSCDIVKATQAIAKGCVIGGALRTMVVFAFARECKSHKNTEVSS